MKTLTLSLVYGLCLARLASATVYFKETFPSEEEFNKNWVYSKHEGKEYGKFVLTPGKFYDNKERDQGIKTSEDARFYAISSKFEDSKFDNLNKDLIVQFSIKHEQSIDCGGGYLKLFDCKLDQEQMHGDSPYQLMFGPDICGHATKKVHVIFNYKGKNLLINKDIRPRDDDMTHLYRLHVKPDNTYQVYIDGEVVEKGELEQDFDFLPPKTIKDPSASKPADWDDHEKIDDPSDEMPQDWTQPELIPDPDAVKPDDWDEEMDGEWQPAQISNPAYKGEWKPRQIDNPAYKGPWVHPEIANPDYEPDDKLHYRGTMCYIGWEFWQVKSGSVFDNIIITDSEAEADELAEITLKHTIPGEKKMKEEFEAAEKKKEAEEVEKKEEAEEVEKKEEAEEVEKKEEDAKDDDDDKHAKDEL